MFLQTDSETKLLYCWMFRLRISEHGPRTRSKRGRSSLTHFRGPRATTVAARGRFISRAISPGTHTQMKGQRAWIFNMLPLLTNEPINIWFNGNETVHSSYQSSQKALTAPLQQTPRSRNDAATQLQNPETHTCLAGLLFFVMMDLTALVH